MKHLIANMPYTEYHALLEVSGEWIKDKKNFYFFILLKQPKHVFAGNRIYMVCRDEILAVADIIDIELIGAEAIYKSNNILWRHGGKYALKYQNFAEMENRIGYKLKKPHKEISERKAAWIDKIGKPVMYEGIDKKE